MAQAHAKHHDYHLVDPSPWPFIGAVGAFLMALGLIYAMHIALPDTDTGWAVFFKKWIYPFPGLLIVLYTMFSWWVDVIKEAHRGDHTRVVQLHLRYGMLLFIASEVMFFVAWFWAFFDASLFPGDAIEVARHQALGGQWPPTSITVLDPFHFPLLNTLILLTSGTTVTWAHHALLHNDRQGLKWGLALTILLGLTFSSIQAYEYAHAPFAFGHAPGEAGPYIYGATFFMATGFHGFHVIVGTIFLIVCLIRAMRGDFTPKQHFGFEAAAWYWHFVDVVWLFLFFCIYVWGSGGAAPH